MKTGTITFRLNLFHIFQGIVVILFLFFITAFVLKSAFNKNNSALVVNTCQQLSLNITSEFNSLSKFSNLFQQDFSIGEYPDIFLISLNTNQSVTALVSKIGLINRDDTLQNQFFINDGQDKFTRAGNTSPSAFTNKLNLSENNCIIKHLNGNNFLLLYLKDNWLENFKEKYNLDNDAYLVIYDRNFNILSETKTFGVLAINHDLLVKELKMISFQDKNDFHIKRIKSGINKINIFSTPLKGTGFFISVFVPERKAFYNFQHYLWILAVEFFLILGFVTFSTIFINYHLTHHIALVINDLKKTDFLKNTQLTKHDDTDIIRKYIGNLENQIKIYNKKINDIASNNAHLEKDLKLAKKIQQNLLPTITPSVTSSDDFELYAYSKSAYDVGGDLYDYFMVDDKHLLITVADVAGKGIPASLFMIYTHTLLRSVAVSGSTVSQIVESLNNKLIEENISEMFVTIFIGILNISNGVFDYCNAAHNFPCLIRTEGNVEEISDTHGIPVGIYPDRNYDSTSIILNPNDQIFIYTDGLIDTVDENGLKFSIDALKYNLMGTWFLSASEVVEKIKTSIEYFRGNSRLSDDITMLSMKFTPKHN